MSAFSLRQTQEFPALATVQVRAGTASCLYPNIQTLAHKIEAFYTVTLLPEVQRIDVTFVNQSSHVAFQVRLKDNSLLYMCFPSSAKRRDMHRMTWIINRAKEVATAQTTDLDQARRVAKIEALELAADMDDEPTYQDCLRGLAEEGCKAVVWTRERVIKLNEKPVLPSQINAAFSRADVAFCDEDGKANFELRLLSMHPSFYVLGAADGKEEQWQSLEELVNASVHVRQELRTASVVKEAVIMYNE